ncbi:uroporphyrinogen decarboxylase [bacterium SCSIO 12643]|nr:uroporphyrinogen decarboxylase [bacterium SCSIO 12643]
MFDITLTDWIGYLASAIVFFSFSFSNVKKLRLVNMVGAAVFVTYGIMLETAYPIVVFNTGIILLHTYHLFFKSTDQNE